MSFNLKFNDDPSVMLNEPLCVMTKIINVHELKIIKKIYTMSLISYNVYHISLIVSNVMLIPFVGVCWPFVGYIGGIFGRGELPPPMANGQVDPVYNFTLVF